MSETTYKWKRFWCPRTGRINLTDGGFLYDPDGYKSEVYNPDLVTLEAISDTRCLILLGEPGLGKTQALRTEQSLLESKIEQAGQTLLFVDLAQYGSEDRLIRELFSSPEFLSWEQGSHQLHVFLDSFDECLLKIETLATLLSEKFKHYQKSADRLYLRITCRTAIWPIILEDNIREIWGKDQVGVYELAPLRRIDIVEAASTSNLSPETFVEEIQKKKLTSLAIKPITLKFLMKIYRDFGGQLLSDQKLYELYFEGCKALCIETKNQYRHRQRSVSGISTQQRVIVAARIAAMTVFANRFSIWTGDSYELSTEDILLQDLCKDYETADGRRFGISEEVVWEVLDTGLFSSRGPDRMGWAHKTYAEFLAAWYLKEHKTELKKILSLIVHPHNTGQRIVPQLYETASWIATMNSAVFQKIMETDPDVLLQSDLTTLDESIKKLLVGVLLQLYDQKKLQYSYNSYGVYSNLNHSSISEQLSLYIEDKAKNLYARYVAIDIAESCRLESVYSLLVKIALDKEQPYPIRMRVANVIARIGSKANKIELKPLTSDPGDDPDNYLKGYALKSVYPDHITTQEVLKCLTQPRSNIIGGSYQDFIAKEFGQKLPESDIAIALNWLKGQPTRRSLRYPFGEFSDAVIIKAWENLESSVILHEFSQVVSIRVRHYDQVIDSYRDNPFVQMLKEDVSKRRILLEAVISSIGDSEKEPFWLSGRSQYSVLYPLKEDFEWLIYQSKNASSNLEKNIYAKLVRWQLDWKGVHQISFLLTNIHSNPALKAEFSSELEPIVLDSHRAKQAKSKYEEIQQMLSDDRHVATLIEPSPQERVAQCLEQMHQGSVEFWCSLCQELSLTPTSQYYNERWEPDITKLPGWEAANENIRNEIISAAKNYIEKGKPNNSTWLGQGKVTHSALGGYRALMLLVLEDFHFASIMPSHIWEKWMGIILDYPCIENNDNKENRQYILQEAYAKAPQELIRVLNILIDHDNSQDNFIHTHNEIVRYIWGDDLEVFLSGKVKDKTLTARNFGDVLKGLLLNQVGSARLLAESLLSLPLPTVKKVRKKAVLAAQMLILHTEDASWSTVWKAIKQDKKFGKCVLESVASPAKYEGQIEAKLTADEAADLYIFLFQEYSESDDLKDETDIDKTLNGPEARSISAVDSIETWQGYIPQRLQERGTQKACAALRKIINELPELEDTLQWRIIEAEALARRQSWRPLSPEEVFQLIIDLEPSRLDLARRVNHVKEELSQKMSEDPKTIIYGSNYGNVNNSRDGSTEQKIDLGQKGDSNKMAWIGIAVTIIGILFTASFSGVFNHLINGAESDSNSQPAMIEEENDSQDLDN